MIESAFRLKTDEEPALSNTPCKQIQPLSRVKSLDGPRVRGISPVGNEKVYGGKDLLKIFKVK